MYDLKLALEYCQGNSAKGYVLCLTCNVHDTSQPAVSVSFGRLDYPHSWQQTVHYEDPSGTFYKLGRQKVGKGYRVVRASVTKSAERPVEPSNVAVAFATEVGPGWYSATEVSKPTKRGLKEGREIISMLTQQPDPDALLELAMSDDSEDFLRQLVFAHERCPETTQVAGTLLGVRLADQQ